MANKNMRSETMMRRLNPVGMATANVPMEKFCNRTPASERRQLNAAVSMGSDFVGPVLVITFANYFGR